MTERVWRIILKWKAKVLRLVWHNGGLGGRLNNFMNLCVL